MKQLEQAVEHLNMIKADLAGLDPRAVHSEVIYMRSSRIKAWSANEAPGAGSDEPPMMLPDRIDAWLGRTERAYHREIEAAAAATARASRLEGQLLARITHEAAQDLVAAEVAAGAGTCVVCSKVIDKAKGERLLEGRCYADYTYRRDHDGRDTPQSLLDARLEREIAAATAAKVKGGRR